MDKNTEPSHPDPSTEKLANPLHPPSLRSKDNRVVWGNLQGSAAAMAIYNLAIQPQQGPLLIITPDIHIANRLEQELLFYQNEQPHLPILQLPDWETLPYDHFSPHQDLVSSRLYTLYQIPQLKQGIVIAALPTLMLRLLPKQHLIAHSFVIKNGDILNFEALRLQLVEAGYRSVNLVIEHGEFAKRGAIIDIFPMGSSLPYRIELLDDEIDSIRTFNPEDQLSVEKIEQIRILPAREYPLSEASITYFRQNWRARFAGNPQEAAIYQSISSKHAAAGAEYYLPLFYEQLHTLFDYLPQHTQLIFSSPLLTTAQEFWQEINIRYQQLRHDLTRPLCPPDEVFIPVEQLFALMKQFAQIHIQPNQHDEQSSKTAQIEFDTKKPPEFIINYREPRPFYPLEQFLTSYTGTVLFCAESSGRREVLLDLLKEINLYPPTCNSWEDFLNQQTQFSSSTKKIAITVAPIAQGLWLQNPDIVLITEAQLFGEQVMQRRLRKKRYQDPDAMVRNLTELQIGSPVVHIDYGVGRYQGLQLIKTGDHEGEYLTLEYADGDKIYVPVTSLHLISRYTGLNAEHAPLQKLGTSQWQKTKDKAAKQVRDVAAELLDIYSRRQATPGYAFPTPDADFQRFRQAFPFEETPDQTQAINDVIADMTSSRSMDRLICGDVGFGKTEVAMQAAFLAIQAGKQIALLVPTTLLANQHLQNFQDRFSSWPVKIASLSRLRSAKEQAKTIEELASGQVDIVVGTHKLIQPTIKFKDLGLLIIDEEHRFGVRQKERIKSLRAHIDTLTLTATPIPRTLNMALAGTRDLSLITTPPLKRLAIKTFVCEYQTDIIHEAVAREMMRGGQIYFLHNEVATIEAQAEKIKQIIPETRLAIAHGQLSERELEKVMADFYHQRFNVLLCSTIIESGIDVPTANTIIINQANRFGLAQLYQLRGRVGRSHHQAYAYLLTPPEAKINKDAQKRLTAISELEELGMGFHLATHDLEIRGAGDLLGEEQSGHIQEIGFSLYMELLEAAVKALREGKEPDLDSAFQQEHHGPEIKLNISAFIPDRYVPDVQTRLTLYKRLARCLLKAEIQDIKSELVDRFGALPDVTVQLLAMTALKLRAIQAGIKKIEVGPQFCQLYFTDNPAINPQKIIELIQKKPQDYQLKGNTTLRVRIPSSQPESRVEQIEQILDKIKQ